MFAPRYQESACGNSVKYATCVTCSIQAASASGVASAVASPCAVRYPMQSVIHSTCCSIDRAMLLSTEGDPGPVTMNRFGNPGVATPRYARGPARPDVHQLHVRPVEHRVVLVALAQPLRSDR